MNRVRAHSRGFTIVELLVVMAIVAIIAGISIPLLARSAFLSESALQTASRELYAYLRAAKIYAVDHHVDTAVVYGLQRYPDPVLENPAPTLQAQGEPASMVVADGFFLARGLTSKEERILRSQGVTNTDNVFVRIGDEEGQYHKMADGTCILNINDPFSLRNVTVLETDLANNILAVQPIDLDNPDLRIFPAHIFTSSGFMDSASTARIELKVAPVPSADPQDRAHTDANGNIQSTALGEPDYRYIGVEIKPSMGRIKIASDKDI